jgi:hypothetical protein
MLVVAYPASAGPVAYAAERQWLPASALRLFTPAVKALWWLPDYAYMRYCAWWQDLGSEHHWAGREPLP